MKFWAMLRRNAMVQALLEMNRNPRLCILCEPLWGIPYQLYVPFATLFMYKLGVDDVHIGFLLSIGMVLQVVASFFGGHLLGKPVLAAELITLAFQQEGVANVRLVSPAADVAAAVGTLPVLGSLSVTELEA